jgi:hypothetical protein
MPIILTPQVVGRLYDPSMFHVSQLKPFHPNYTPVFSDFQVLHDFSTHDLQPETQLSIVAW